MNKIILVGEVGKIVHVRKEENDPIIVNPPLLEVDCNFDTGEPFQVIGDDLEKEIIFNVAPIYGGWGKFGHYGDIIIVSSLGDSWYKIDLIGRLAFNSTNPAVDILPFIVLPNGKIYFVGIHKKIDDVVGKYLIGGFVDKGRMSIETRPQAAIREANEEVGLKIIVPVKQKKVFNNKPMPKNLAVKIILGGFNINTKLFLLGIYKTSVSKKEIILQRMRDQETTVYYTIMEFPKNLSKAEIENLFTAEDDADGIYIYELKEGVQGKGIIPRFSEPHHRKIFADAQRRVRETIKAWHGVY